MIVMIGMRALRNACRRSRPVAAVPWRRAVVTYSEPSTSSIDDAGVAHQDRDVARRRGSIAGRAR